ncbi:Abi-alpha family protein [Nocardia sp. NPDC050406]|uniref:Abi-alpha family protein n=1 Tax=Nocardia sp. NPDC050406 TaxID=3364318 RepID=UPI003790C795
MDVTESDSDPDDSVEHSTELVLRASALPAVPQQPSAGTVRTATGVARVAWSALSEATAWGVGTALGVTGTVVRGSMAGQPPREILTEAGAQVRDSMLRALGVRPAAEGEAAPESSPLTELRARGAELLRQSADLHSADESHPAYSRILDQLAPDEARIVRFLYLDGPQPLVDVRTGRTANGRGGRFNLVGDDAGLRYPNRIDEYLTNLRRLGLLDFGREPLGNPNRYQLIETLPEVRKLLKRAGFTTKVLYRSIELTSFGGGFVRTCLPIPTLDQAL